MKIIKTFRKKNRRKKNIYIYKSAVPACSEAIVLLVMDNTKSGSFASLNQLSFRVASVLLVMDNTKSGRRKLHIHGFALQNYNICQHRKGISRNALSSTNIHWLSYSYHMGLTNLL